MLPEPVVVPAPPSPPPRPIDGHKGTFGTVIVVGGSDTMVGAPALCATAAFRAGAGLVKIAAPADVMRLALTIEPSATGVPLRGDEGQLLWAINDADHDAKAVLAIGPGMGEGEAARLLVLTLLHGRRSIVLDADGLNFLAGTGKPRPPIEYTPELVLTPHPGEFRRLAEPLGITESPVDPATRPAAARRLAIAHRAVVVLKGRSTVVTDGTRVYVNGTGNPALATAGTGDTLTGCIAALMAQGTDAFGAAALGVHAHGAAGDDWAREHGERGMLARDLADRLPRALRPR